jgi:hypothetical protein
MANTLAVLGVVERGLGNPGQAKQHVLEALRISGDTGAFQPSQFALPAVALLLADGGEKERAVELYALASRYPFVANSRWFEDVFGRHIATIASDMSPDVVTAARERGRARDLEATLDELIAEWGE